MAPRVERFVPIPRRLLPQPLAPLLLRRRALFTTVHLVAAITVVALLVPTDTVIAATIHVPGDQPTLQAALDQTAPGDTVLVAAGLYAGAGNTSLTAPSHDFVLRSEGGATLTTIDCAGQGRVLWLQTHTRATHIEGFTFRNGDATQEPYTGGGILVGFAASPVIADCRFLDSRAGGNLSNGGGALAFHNAEPLVERCRFEGNASETLQGIGGAVSLFHAAATFRDCTFLNNWSGGTLAAGGAILAWEGSAITVDHCTFKGNQTLAEGGAIFIGFPSAGATITDCDFIGNQAHTAGALFQSPGTHVLRCRFVDNQAQFGGAMEEAGSSASLIEECVYAGNRAGVRGGALRLIDAPSEVRGCIFAGNEAPEGGAVVVHGADPTITGSTFFDNVAPQGAAISVRPTQVGSHVTLVNTILAGGRLGAATACGYNCTITASCCDVHGNEGGDWVGCLAGQLGIDGNFSEDPLFCAPFAGDWTLDSASPCLPGQHPGGVSCGLIGALPAGCGATAVAPTTWGRLKATFIR